jgi:hypothetical protein
MHSSSREATRDSSVVIAREASFSVSLSCSSMASSSNISASSREEKHDSQSSTGAWRLLICFWTFVASSALSQKPGLIVCASSSFILSFLSANSKMLL